MTREEAIICKIYLEDLDKYHTCNEYKLLMGLLEQELCEDCISRQAAINLIESIETERLKGNVELIYAPAIKGLRALPPVTPQPKMMDVPDNNVREMGDTLRSTLWLDNMLKFDAMAKGGEE